MRAFKSISAVISVLFPVLYCGGLIYYFLVYDYGGSLKDAEEYGLGPTLLGLAVVGLLFCIPLIWMIVRIFIGLRSPRPDTRGGPDGPPHDDGGGFDADAVVARYMAQRSAEAASNLPAVPPTHEGGSAARRAGFGRKIK